MRPIKTYSASPIAVALAKFRQENQLSVNEMTALLKISKPTLVALVRHGAAPGLGTLLKMARFFQWTAYEVGVMTMWPGPPKVTWRKKPKRRYRSDAA